MDDFITQVQCEEVGSEEEFWLGYEAWRDEQEAEADLWELENGGE